MKSIYGLCSCKECRCNPSARREARARPPGRAGESPLGGGGCGGAEGDVGGRAGGGR